MVQQLGLEDGLIPRKLLCMSITPETIYLKNIVAISMVAVLKNYSVILLILLILINPMRKSNIDGDSLGEQFMNMQEKT